MSAECTKMQTLHSTMNYSDCSASEATGAIISEKVLLIFQWILLSVVCQVISVFGIGSNIMNIICFVKQGFKDSINVSLLGLAISDLGCLTTLVWTNLCLTPSFATADLPFDPIEFQYLTSAMPHATFTRITSWITAVIAMERCLCITAPLKVKSIITPTRVAVIIGCIFLILITSVAPLYVVNRLDLKFSNKLNKSIIGLVYSSNRDDVERVSFSINNICVPFSAFMIISICAIILARKLQSKTKWLHNSATCSQADIMSNRNLKVAKMVIVIAVLFIICFLPLSFFFIAVTIEPELSMYGKYRNLVTIFAMFVIFLESINSSMNIFIYYHMSSKYRDILTQVIWLDRKIKGG